MEKLVRYGIEYDGELLGTYTQSNENGEFCVNVSHYLDTSTENIWMTDSRQQAIRIANTDTPWYNAGESSPGNSRAGKCKVATITLEWEVLKDDQ